MTALALFAVLGAALAVVVRVIGGTGGSRRRRRLTSGTPRSAITDAVEGQPVYVVGTVTSGEAFDAPFTGRRCVYLDVRIERHVGGHDHWETVAHEIRGVPFTIDDGTGRVLVDPDGARIALDRDAGLRSAAVDSSITAAVELLARHGATPRGGLRARRLRYREGAIELGVAVAIVGAGVREPDPGAVGQIASYRDGPATRLRMGGSPNHPILITDAPAMTS